MDFDQGRAARGARWLASVHGALFAAVVAPLMTFVVAEGVLAGVAIDCGAGEPRYATRAAVGMGSIAAVVAGLLGAWTVRVEKVAGGELWFRAAAAAHLFLVLTVLITGCAFGDHIVTAVFVAGALLLFAWPFTAAVGLVAAIGVVPIVRARNAVTLDVRARVALASATVLALTSLVVSLLVDPFDRFTAISLLRFDDPEAEIVWDSIDLTWAWVRYLVALPLVLGAIGMFARAWVERVGWASFRRALARGTHPEWMLAEVGLEGTAVPVSPGDEGGRLVVPRTVSAYRGSAEAVCLVRAPAGSVGPTR